MRARPPIRHARTLTLVLGIAALAAGCGTPATSAASTSANTAASTAPTPTGTATTLSDPAASTDSNVGGVLADPAAASGGTVAPTGGEGWYYLANYRPIAETGAQRTTMAELGGQVRNYAITATGGGSMAWRIAGVCSIVEGYIGAAGDTPGNDDHYTVSLAADAIQVYSKQVFDGQGEPVRVDVSGAQTLTVGMVDQGTGAESFGITGARAYCAHAPGEADPVD